MLDFGCIGLGCWVGFVFTVFHFVAQAGLKLTSFCLSLSNYKHAPPYPTLRFHVF